MLFHAVRGSGMLHENREKGIALESSRPEGGLMRKARSMRSRWAPRWQRTPCWSARANGRSSPITEGFGDALRVGYQNRPDLFALRIVLPEMLYERVVEIKERISAQGEILRPLELDAARLELERSFGPEYGPWPLCSCTPITTRSMSRR